MNWFILVRIIKDRTQKLALLNAIRVIQIKIFICYCLKMERPHSRRASDLYSKSGGGTLVPDNAIFKPKGRLAWLTKFIEDESIKQILRQLINCSKEYKAYKEFLMNFKTNLDRQYSFAKIEPVLNWGQLRKKSSECMRTHF